MLRALGLANGGGKLNPAESNVEGDVKVKKKKRKATTASDGVRKSRRTRGENPEGAGSTTRNTSKASSSAGGDADDDVERASDENRMLKYEALLERHGEFSSLLSRVVSCLVCLRTVVFLPLPSTSSLLFLPPSLPLLYLYNPTLSHIKL